MSTQFVYVTIWYEENEQDVKHSCFLPGIPHKGDEVVIKDMGNGDIEGTVTEVAYISHSASSAPLESYVTIFMDINRQGRIK